MKDFERDANGKVLFALEKLKETTTKAKEKRDKKNWNEISLPFSLADGLNNLTRDELNSIRRRLEIKNASSLKKAELIALLQEKIPALIEKSFLPFDKDRLNLIKNIGKRGGYITVPTLEDFQIEYFRSLGLLFSGTLEENKVIVMPEEIVEQSANLVTNLSILSIVQRNTNWIKLTHGLLYYYGSLSITELIKMLENYLKEPLDVAEYLSVIDAAAIYYREIRINQYGFSNARVFDPERVKQEQQKRMGVAFYPFSKDQLLIAGEPGYVERNESYKQFVNFLTQNYTISRKEADGIVEECVYATQIGENSSDILQFLQSRIELNDFHTIQACMAMVVNLMNNTRVWFLKGHTASELSALEQKELQPLQTVKNKRIGRNDPCPCGSMKKYKKCCGK
ncbi:SEC-C metal-binding domain-containing protein [Neobacillus sp. NPDC058068]|uniref:SEC-C metal-binding domain-containing protein n=1 Tax=Neobacillus sp. NPDC058068 TaxID=3346325 RepID=UPI0036DB4B09